MLQRCTLVTLLLHHITLLLHPFYTMLHPCNTFVTSLLNCYIFVTPLLYHYYTMLHPCNTFVTSLQHLLYPYYTIYIVAFCPFLTFCPDTVITYNNVLMYNSVLINTYLIYVMQCVHCTLYKLYSVHVCTVHT